MINAWGITDKGAVRQQNQDGYYLQRYDSNLAVGVVCDGMGGARAGNVASLLAVETFSDILDSLRKAAPEDAALLLREAAEAANSAVYQRACADPDCRGMGTTMVAALVSGRTAHLLNIGDSRAYHVGETGISKLTRDHSVVENMVERGDITPAQARRHPSRNLITRALGPDAQVEADSFRVPWQQGDFLLLCSDGLVNTVTDQEMLFEVMHEQDLDGCLDRLLAKSKEQGAPDNVTVVLLQNL